MAKDLAHGVVTPISELPGVSVPCTVRTYGLLATRSEHSQTVVLAGLEKGAQVLVDVSGCPETPLRLNLYYEVIGELVPFSLGRIIRSRVIREMKTESVSIDFYDARLREALTALEAAVKADVDRVVN